MNAPGAPRCDFPWTVAVAVIAIAATGCAMAGVAITGPFVHVTWGHLVRDLSLVLIAGVAYEQPLRARWPALVVAGVVVPALAVSVGTDAIAYYGLSGLSHARLAAALGFELHRQRGRRRAYVAGLAAAGAAKIGYELVTGAPAFPMALGDGIRVAPLAHAAGALVGLWFTVVAPARPLHPCRPGNPT